MTKWMISIMLRDGQDTGALEADSFEGLVEALIQRGVDLGVAYRVRENRWAAFTDDEIDLLEGELPRTANLRPVLAEITDELELRRA